VLRSLPPLPDQPAANAVERSSKALHPDYRPDIDGLRAVAVLAVIGFHAFPTWIRGGFVGVDVFFVISGYLISTILFTGMERGSFSFVQFYRRRIRRIFPALIVVLLVCMAAGWFALFSFEYARLGKHVAGSAAFVSNFVLWSEAGYFDKDATTKPLLHIWSLGIEEQFYIVWPLLLFLTWRRKAATPALLVLLLVSSFALNVRTAAAADSAADYYSPLTRFWELMAGAVLAYLSLYQPPSRWVRQIIGAGAAHDRAASNIKAAAGLLLIAAAVLTIDETRDFPGWWALLPVVGTYLMIAAGPGAWINDKLLAARVLVAIGLISYPLYLWHWPLLSFIRIVDGQPASPPAAALAALLSFVLAALTYLLVERPIRFGKPTPIKAIALLAAMTAVGASGYYTYARHGFPSRNPGLEDLVAAEKDFDFGDARTVNGIVESNETYHGIIGDYALVMGKPGADEIVLAGDSTMQQYIPRVRELAETGAVDLDHNRIVLATHYGCPPIPDIARDVNPTCAEFVDKLISALDNSVVKTVALTGWWTPQFTESEYYLRSDPRKTLLRDSVAAQARALGNFSDLISHLVKSGKRVFVLLETPSSGRYDPETMLPTGWHRLIGKPNIPESPTRADMEKYVGKIDQKIQDIAEAAGAHVIKPLDYLCDQDVCPAFAKDGKLMYFNFGHLRAAYAREHATYIDQIFRPQPGTAIPKNGPPQ
jgi:peptidoglycan/LPS O-acetylase OafA/YrhL